MVAISINRLAANENEEHTIYSFCSMDDRHRDRQGSSCTDILEPDQRDGRSAHYIL
jgi:hypothetical protein